MQILHEIHLISFNKSFRWTIHQQVIPNQGINTLRPRQNGCHFPDNIFNCIFLNENVWISLEISLKFVPRRLINNIPALVEIMAWRRPGDKPLSEPMVVSLLTHICVTLPQWVNSTQDRHVIFFHKEWFSHLCQDMTENANVILCFLK